MFREFWNMKIPVVNVKFIWETFHIKLCKEGKQGDVRYKHSIRKVLLVYIKTCFLGESVQFASFFFF